MGRGGGWGARPGLLLDAAALGRPAAMQTPMVLPTHPLSL